MFSIFPLPTYIYSSQEVKIEDLIENVDSYDIEERWREYIKSSDEKLLDDETCLTDYTDTYCLFKNKEGFFILKNEVLLQISSQPCISCETNFEENNLEVLYKIYNKEDDCTNYYVYRDNQKESTHLMKIDGRCLSEKFHENPFEIYFCISSNKMNNLLFSVKLSQDSQLFQFFKSTSLFPDYYVNVVKEKAGQLFFVSNNKIYKLSPNGQKNLLLKFERSEEIHDFIYGESESKILGISYYKNGKLKWQFEDQINSNLYNTLKYKLKVRNLYREDSDIHIEINGKFFYFKITASIHPPFEGTFDTEDNSITLRGHKEYLRLQGMIPFFRPKIFIEISAQDGQQIPCFLTLPSKDPLFDPLPLVLLVHGGPEDAATNDFEEEVQLYANRGYAVIQPNYRGSLKSPVTYSASLMRKGRGAFGKEMLADLYDAVNYLIFEKIVDPNRIAILGGSAGGYAALMGAMRVGLDYSVTKSGFKGFSCAIAEAPVSDLLEDIKHTLTSPNHSANLEIPAWNYRLFGQVGDFMEVFSRPEQQENLKTLSPIYHVEKLEMPLLLIHGEMDEIVSFSQSEALVKKLDELNKIYEFVHFPDEGHGIKKHNNKLQNLIIQEKFLKKYITDRGI